MVTKEKIPLNLAPREKRAVKLLLSRLRKAYGEQIQQAYLFGSKARGDATVDSDIDLLVLVKQETWALKDEISDLVADINLEYDLLVDLRVIGVERWQHLAEIQAGLYRTISQDAIPLAK
jgi:predicted nucleotidyltransferase